MVKFPFQDGIHHMQGDKAKMVSGQDGGICWQPHGSGHKGESVAANPPGKAGASKAVLAAHGNCQHVWGQLHRLLFPALPSVTRCAPPVLVLLSPEPPMCRGWGQTGDKHLPESTWAGLVRDQLELCAANRALQTSL